MSNHGISLEEPHDEFPIETEKGPIALIVDVQNWMEKNADTFESQEKAPLRQMADASRWKVAEYVKFLIVSLRKLHT